MDMAVVFTEISSNPARREKAGKIVTEGMTRETMIMLTQTVKQHGGKTVKGTADMPSSGR